ncbi:MAG: hypothetical protein FWE38_03305 [Firmicutes bacterium]|nr:hypothetical protein [Bacillota bacterium]
MTPPFDKDEIYPCILCEQPIEKKSIQKRTRPLACKPCREEAEQITPEQLEESIKALNEQGIVI